jgi:hypothetical protein
VFQVVLELLGWPQDVTLRLDPKGFESKVFSKKNSFSHPSISKMFPSFLISEVRWRFAAKPVFARMKMVSPSC